MKSYELPNSREQVWYGTLQVYVMNELDRRPISNALVQVYYSNDFTSPIYDLRTGISGFTGEIQLPAPPIEYSLSPGTMKPYSEYNLRITASGYQTVEIYGSQIFPTVDSIQPVEMVIDVGQAGPKVIRIPPNVLYENN